MVVFLPSRTAIDDCALTSVTTTNPSFGSTAMTDPPLGVPPTVSGTTWPLSANCTACAVSREPGQRDAALRRGDPGYVELLNGGGEAGLGEVQRVFGRLQNTV